MDLNEAKKLVNCNGERVILVEDGNPTMVLLSYEAYKKLSGNLQGTVHAGLFDMPAGEPGEGQENSGDELSLEDLPF